MPSIKNDAQNNATKQTATSKNKQHIGSLLKYWM